MHHACKLKYIEENSRLLPPWLPASLARSMPDGPSISICSHRQHSRHFLRRTSSRPTCHQHTRQHARAVCTCPSFLSLSLSPSTSGNRPPACAHLCDTIDRDAQDTQHLDALYSLSAPLSWGWAGGWLAAHHRKGARSPLLLPRP